MRIERVGSSIRVTLSERNLRALLSKLRMPDSACTIYMSTDGDVPGIYVSAEPDDQHYAGRTPGRMHPITEEVLREKPNHLDSEDYENDLWLYDRQRRGK